MIAEREARLGTMQERIDSLERIVLANPASAAVLDRLVRDLVWDDGPRALRAVLPLARLIRRLSRR